MPYLLHVIQSKRVYTYGHCPGLDSVLNCGTGLFPNERTFHTDPEVSLLIQPPRTVPLAFQRIRKFKLQLRRMEYQVLYARSQSLING